MLPTSVRQNAAHALIGKLAPRLNDVSRAVVEDRSIPRIIVGFVSSPSGLGQSARLAARAFMSEGYQVLGVDMAPYFYERAGVVPCALPEGQSHRGPAHVIAVINAPYLPYALSLLGASFLKDKYITGYWAWELQQIPETWRQGLSAVHEIAVPSQFVAHALASLNTKTSVRVAPHPVSLDLPPSAPWLDGTNSPDQPFTVLSTVSIGSGFVRKNPLGLIGAFKQAFGPDTAARLRLHVPNAEHYPPSRPAIMQEISDAPNIEVSWEPMTRTGLFDWWGTPDLVAALHRAEGFGLPLAEAMCAGFPVMATGWSGNLDFMTKQNSHLIDFELVPVNDPQGKYAASLGTWAEPDIAHAARKLRSIADQRDDCRMRAIEAAPAVAQKLSSAAYCNAIVGLS